MTSELAQAIFQRDEVIKHIKEKESERLKNDIRNFNKYNYLYDVLYALDEVIRDLESGEDIG